LGVTAYASGAARFIAQELGRDKHRHGLDFRVELLTWIGPHGHLQRFELARGTDDPKIDALIRGGFEKIGVLPQQVPEGLPQAMRIRVTSTDA